MLKTFLCAIAICFSLINAGCATNPITGKSELMLVSEEQANEIGEKYAPEVEKQLGGAIEDQQIQNYVQSVGDRVVRASHTPEEDFTFTAVNDPSINAMALPNGQIFITRGMLEAVSNEAQLASILAHETAHVTARHVASAMSTQIGISILMQVASRTVDIPAGAQTIANYSRQLISLKFSRNDERQADIGGLEYLVDAGYDPQAMTQTMDILAEKSGSRIEFLSSHPNPGTRSDYLKERISQGNYPANLRTGRQAYQENVLDRLNALPQPQETTEKN